MKRLLWVFCFLLNALSSAGPAQIVFIPQAEGTPILNSQGQMRAAYLVGMVLRTNIVNQTNYPIAAFYVESENVAAIQTVTPLFHEANFYLIMASGSAAGSKAQQASFNTTSITSSLLKTILENSSFNNQTVVICAEYSNLTKILSSYHLSSDSDQSSLLLLQNGSHQVTTYKGVHVNGFPTW